MKTESHHAEWLELLEISGPFLSLPVLERVFPQGLDVHDADHAAKLRLAREEWIDEQEREDPDPMIHDAWIHLVLTETLEYTPEVLLERGGIPSDLSVDVAEHHVTLRPDFVLFDPEEAPGVRRARLIIKVYPAGHDLEKPVEGSRWASSPASRMVHLCRSVGVRLGLLTNGETWILVDAPEGENAAFISWLASLWSEEQLTLRAFRSLLGVRRFFGVSKTETLETMLAESATFQAEVTEQLGAQVRRAVEVLVQAFDKADLDSGRELLHGVQDSELYEAALTIMMRLVFLFFAEENELLPLADDLYQQHYAASTLRGQLREEADKVGLEVLERRQDAWSRLLATFRAIYGGVEHEALRLPPYGGSLFDPDRFPFLEGRVLETTWGEVEARPLPIDNRTVLHLLDSLQLLQMRSSRGIEARKLSFRALDIEQIGHVYEMSLDHEVRRAEVTQLGLSGAKGVEPEISLDQLEQYHKENEARLLALLEEETRRGQASLKKALDIAPETVWLDRLRVACGNQPDLLDRILPYQALIRPDPWGEPVIIRAGSMYVTAGSERRSTGTYYTPRAITEEMVTHALEPLVYEGPTEGKPRHEWKLKDPDRLLELKICDPAMGSGAFLVQVVRWLSERLVEAWEGSGSQTGEIDLNPAGRRSAHDFEIPGSSEERITLARRLVTDRCIYGVDVNPLAVEMAKLSLWLVTLAKGRPFSFLDHALKCGDSLLGIHLLDQVRFFHIEPERGKSLHATLLDPTRQIESAIDEARELRGEIESFTVLDVRDAEQKSELNRRAEAGLGRVRILADLVVGAAISTADKDMAALDSRLQALGDQLPTTADSSDDAASGTMQAEARAMLDAGKPPLKASRRPFHWPLQFPEVFLAHGGFDSIVSNPPFLGGVYLATNFGITYERYLKSLVPESSGFVDLAAYFHRRAVNLTSNGGTTCLLGPQNLTTTGNRRASGDVILRQGRRIIWGRKRMRWPGSASLEVCSVCYAPNEWKLVGELDGQSVGTISSSLEMDIDVSSVERLRPWLQYSQGTEPYGSAFVRPEGEWEPFIKKEPKLREYLRPYVNAQILCSTPNFRSDLLIVDLGESEKEDLAGLEETVAYLEREVGRERANQTRQVHEPRPWLFWDKRTKAYQQARQLEQVLVCPYVSKHLPMVFVNPEFLFSRAIKFFISDDSAVFALLQSSVFMTWVVATSALREARVAFSTKNSLDTFPQPDSLELLRSVGQEYWQARLSSIRSREVGITELLNAFHDPEQNSPDISALRTLHRRVDEAVLRVYGWDDLRTDLDFNETPQGIRFAPAPSIRSELVQRIVQLNNDKYSTQRKTRSKRR